MRQIAALTSQPIADNPRQRFWILLTLLLAAGMTTDQAEHLVALAGLAALLAPVTGRQP